MKVNEVMTTDVEFCDPGTDLAAAAMIMWRRNCGAVPVVEPGSRRAIGVITDRDICIAVATKHRRAAEISVGEVFSGTVHACRPDDDVALAMEIMRSSQVRRVPVVDDEGSIRGVVSLFDLLVRGPGAAGRRSKAADTELVEVMRGICEPSAEVPATRPTRRTRSSSSSTSRRAPAAAYARGK